MGEFPSWRLRKNFPVRPHRERQLFPNDRVYITIRASNVLLMRPTAPLYCNEHGLSETVSVALMVFLVIALAAVIGSIVFGLVIFYPKSAYIPVQTEVKNVSPDNWYLSVFHMNGDAAYLNLSGKNEGMPVYFQFTTPAGGTVRSLPDPSDGPATWKPGDTMFVYNQSNRIWVAKNESLARQGAGLPQGVWRFDVVSQVDDVLVYTTKLGVGVPTPTEGPTPVGQYTIMASAGAGGTISPSGSVVVNSGSNQPFTITNNTGYIISDVLIDGVSQGAIASYTFTNVVANGHTISAVFKTKTPPTVTAVSPDNGPKGGGTVVTITGTGFTGATSVSFGGIPATSFTINSATQITATSPAQNNPGTINVIVTTPDGTSGPSPPKDHFRYTN